MLLVAAAVVAATGAGLVYEHHFHGAQALSRRLLALMLYVLLPFVSFVNIAHVQMTFEAGVGLGFAYVALICVGLLAYLVGKFRLRLSTASLGAVMCSVVVANTSYLGLPMSVTLLDPGALGAAVAYDQLVSAPALFVLGFGVGALFGEEAATGRGARSCGFEAS